MAKNPPRSIGIIIDGNRRWAKLQGLPSLEGHRQGLARAKEAILWADELGIREMTVYAFSTENWNRALAEVSYLMGLFQALFDREFEEIVERGCRVRFIGQRERLPAALRKSIEALEKKTKDAPGMLLQIALSYGGRAEILDAVNQLLATGAQSVEEEDFRAAMWSAGMSDPDLIIRTGGDKRLSNFLLYQAAYSELFFTDTLWPAFTREELVSILDEYASRDRRHGK